MQLKDMIFDLSNIPAPAGFEDKARERVRELLSPFVDEMWTDALGNLIALKKCGKPNAKKLMFDAHMDETGLIITGIEEGFLRFSCIGGLDPRMLPAHEIRVLTDPPIYGVIDVIAPHTLTQDELNKPFDTKKLYIDIGLTDDEAKKRVPLGTPAVFAAGCISLSESQISGKALDNRACVAIIIKAMEQLSLNEINMDIYCLISAQEELGFRGAVTGAYSVAPDLSIVLDVTHAVTPDSKKDEIAHVGKGPAIGVGPNINREISKLLFDAAKKNNIPHQTEVMGGSSSTNAWVIQTSRFGVPTGLISLPLKYMHSPVETIDMSDAEAMVRLIVEFVTAKEASL